MSSEGHLSLQEAADYLGVCTKTLRRRIAEGALPAFRVGRVIRLRRRDVETLLVPVPNVRTAARMLHESRAARAEKGL